MFQLILLTVILGSIPIQVHSQASESPSCLAPVPPLSSQTGNGDDRFRPNCEWRDLCSNDPAAGVAISTMECKITGSISSPNCHLWGSDGSHGQMLFIYLLKITSDNLILHYFNDSQQYSSKQQLCVASNNFEKWINESCAELLPNQNSVCCYSSNVNIRINFTGGNMKVHFPFVFIEIPVEYLDCTMVTTAATLLISNSTWYNYSSISPSKNPSSEEKLTSLVAGVSTPLLVIVLVLLAIITIMAIVWIKERKATKNVHNHDTEFEEQDRRYTTLTRQEYPDITLNHPTDALYAVVDMNKQKQEREMKHDEKNPPIPVEKKGQVALKDLYAVVDKQQKKKQNEETPLAQSNPVDGVYYNTAAIRKVHAAEYEVAVPQIPPRMVALYNS